MEEIFMPYPSSYDCSKDKGPYALRGDKLCTGQVHVGIFFHKGQYDASGNPSSELAKLTGDSVGHLLFYGIVHGSERSV